MSPVLKIDHLSMEFPLWNGALYAIDDVSISVNAGEIVGLVGESGCGKSVTSMAALRLLPDDAYRVTQGDIGLLGVDVLKAKDRDMRRIRGGGASMIFQEPMTALNPTRRIGAQMIELIRTHQSVSRKAAHARAIELLVDMRIADAPEIMDRYPFELSGGMRQRVVIAMAFANDPKIIIADEPTTALDVTVQRQVLTLLQMRAREVGAAVLLITHDLGVVSEYTDRLYVMYAGKVVETGKTDAVITNPQHPYTRALLAATPDRAEPKSLLASIPGGLPDLRQPGPGCRFAPRCALGQPVCAQKQPILQDCASGQAACFSLTGEFDQ
jgi:peptide/nickel transport system ATP-binding protein